MEFALSVPNSVFIAHHTDQNERPGGILHQLGKSFPPWNPACIKAARFCTFLKLRQNGVNQLPLCDTLYPELAQEA